MQQLGNAVKFNSESAFNILVKMADIREAIQKQIKIIVKYCGFGNIFMPKKCR